MVRLLISIVALSTLGVTGGLADSNWPQFRGARSLGTSGESNLPDTWSTTDNVVWQATVPGRGWSSPIVWGDKIFVTSVINDGKSEVPRKGLYLGGNRAEPPKTVHHWMVYCFDWKTGKQVWEATAYKGLPTSPSHIKNSY